MLHGLLVHWVKFLKRSTFLKCIQNMIFNGSLHNEILCFCFLFLCVQSKNRSAHFFCKKKKIGVRIIIIIWMCVMQGKIQPYYLIFQSKHYFNVSLPRPYPLQFLKRLSCLLQLLILFLAGCSQSFNFHLEFIYLWSCQTNLTLRIHKHLS